MASTRSRTLSETNGNALTFTGLPMVFLSRESGNCLFSEVRNAIFALHPILELSKNREVRFMLLPVFVVVTSKDTIHRSGIGGLVRGRTDVRKRSVSYIITETTNVTFKNIQTDKTQG